MCTDVGGTFTDVVILDEDGTVEIFKSLSTPRDPVLGMMEGLRLAAESRRQTLRPLLGECHFLSHGSTVATNAFLEKRVGRIGLICTRGHRDILLFREGGKLNPFDWDLDYPEPFVPRQLTVGVTERISSEGEVLTPLVEEEVREAIGQLKEQSVEAIAIALLWSFVNPVHELRVAELVKEEWPEVPVSLSSVVNPVIREYRRTVGTAVDASLQPLVSSYVRHLKSRLADEGFRGDLYLLTSSGGITSPEDMAARPAYSVDSGPAVAPVAGRYFAHRELGLANVLTCDMGGTSFDVSRVSDGEIGVTLDWELGDERLSLPKVDVRSIGAGGGSIAWVDSGGLIRVGPKSTGSEPGPACYARGGQQATVTDAALVLGYYDPDNFAGGRMSLDTRAAEEALMVNVAEPLGLDLLTAAYTVWKTVCANMTEAIRDITVRQGIDPREYAMVAGGGAAGAHIVPIAADLGVCGLVIPRVAGVLSAFGGAVADLVREFHQAFLTSTDSFCYEGVNAVLETLTKLAGKFLDALSVPKGQRLVQYSVEARYPFQERELTIPLRRSAFDSPRDVDLLLEDFHETHKRVRGSMEPGQMAELTLWKARAVGLTAEMALATRRQTRVTATRESSSRAVFFADLGGMVSSTPVLDGSTLSAGDYIEGPAIIEQPTTAIVVFPATAVRVSEHGSFVVELEVR
jgi:N-methylhydantoinase A